MGCNCGGSRGTTAKSYVWTSADKTTTKTYRTEIEAKAAVVRTGGTYQPK